VAALAITKRLRSILFMGRRIGQPRFEVQGSRYERGP